MDRYGLVSWYDYLTLGLLIAAALFILGFVVWRWYANR